MQVADGRRQTRARNEEGDERVCREMNKDDLTNVGRYDCQRARKFVSRDILMTGPRT